MASYQPHISNFDKSFSESKTSGYQLFLQLDRSGLTYTIFDTQTSSFIGLESYLFNDVYNDYSLLNPVSEILESSSMLKKSYHKFVVSYVNNRSTLIPKPLFKPDELKNYHQFNFSKQEDDAFLTDYLLNLGAYNVYSVPNVLINVFNKIDNVIFHHFSTALIESSLLYAKKNNAISLIDVHVLPLSFQIIAINNQSLELYNSFNYQTSEDFIYYLLFVLNQLNIKNTEATIRLIGAVDKNSAIYDMVNKYIQTINFTLTPNELKYSYVFEKITKHYYYSLFNQYLCE